MSASGTPATVRGSAVELPVGTAATVRVPATSANLGPGFDAFGLALELRDEVRARVVPQGVRVHVDGEGAGRLPADSSHLVVRVALEELTAAGHRVPGLEVFCRNVIPQGRGLGSSASAIVAGLALAHGLVASSGLRAPGGAPSDAAVRERLLVESSRREGHPDNAAPAVLGGFTVAWSGGGDPLAPAASSGSAVRSVRLPVHPDVRAVVCVPAEQLATSRARALLPATVPHADAALTAGRAGLLVHALTAAPELLLDATVDRLHQEQRGSAVPRTAALLRSLRAAGLAAVVSGAGPSVLVLTSSARAGEVADLVAREGGWRVLEVPVAEHGVSWTTGA